MKSYEIRVPPDVLQRLDWISAAQGTERAETIRKILSDGSKDARPPERINERVIAASETQWAAWRDAAAQLGMSLDDLITSTMDGIVRKVFR